jgi:uncharacterized protein YyaL (SSP411 family)
MLMALDAWLGPMPELVLLASANDAEADEVLRDLRRRFWPNKVVARRPTIGHSSALDAIFQGKAQQGSEPMLYVCEDFACQAPVSGKAAILGAWQEKGDGIR